jgi:hypothetical protein
MFLNLPNEINFHNKLQCADSLIKLTYLQLLHLTHKILSNLLTKSGLYSLQTLLLAPNASWLLIVQISFLFKLFLYCTTGP